MKVFKSTLPALLTIFSVQASADLFDVTGSVTQNELLDALTQGFTVPVAPSIDGLLFKSTVNDVFSLQRDTDGSEAPGILSNLGENRAYQNLTFKNTSTNNIWVLSALNEAPGTPVEAILKTKSLTLNNTTLALKTQTGAGFGQSSTLNYVEELILDGNGQIALLKLNNAHIDTAPSPATSIVFASDGLIDVSGTDNVIQAAIDPSTHELELRVNQNSELLVTNLTEIKADNGGWLTLKSGSLLKIEDSQVFLTHLATDTSLQSTIDNSTIELSGIFGSEETSLFLTDPRISNSTISLGNNDRFFSTRRTAPVGFQAGSFYFSADNLINLESGAQLLGRDSSSDEMAASFYFENGKTSINGSGVIRPALRALDIHMDNATLEYSNVDLDNDLTILNMRNNSTFRTLSGGNNFDNLKFLNVSDSTLSGDHFYSRSALLTANFTDATIRIDKASRTSAASFFLSGIDGFGPDRKAIVTFSGDNTVFSRIDPAGTDLGVDMGIVTGVKAYSDAIFFTRNTPFTDETTSVIGLDNVTTQFEAFAPGLTAQDYATGGEKSDGVYDVLYFNFDNTATTPATADSDTVPVRLGGSMPALLTASQVATPSVDNKVSYKLELQPLTTLLTHPAVKPTHTLGATATSTVSGNKTITTVTTLLPAQTSNTSSTGTATSTVDPVTGNTNTTTVKVEPNQNVAGSAVQTVTTTVTSPSGAVLSNTSQTTALKVPTATGTANQVVTSLVTPNTGGNTTSSSTSIIQSPATGSTNKGAAANLLVNSGNNGNTSTLYALNTLTNSQIAPHLESVHAEPYSSYMTVSLEHTDMVINTVLNQAAPGGMFSTGRTAESTLPETHRRTWLDISYSEGDIEGDGDLGDFDYTLSGLTIGQDLVVSGDRILGAYFSFGTQKMDEHDKAIQDFDGDIYHLGLYLNEVDVGGWDLRGLLGYAYGDHDSTRTVVLSNSIATPSAGFDSHSFYAGIQGTMVGYQNDWVTLSPELGLSYIYYKQESLTESGDPNLSLMVDSADAQSIIASIGVNARFASFSEKVPVYPLAFLRYEHDFYANRNNDHKIDAALVAHPDYKQTFVGQNRGENSIIAGLGLGSDISSNLQVQGGFVIAEHTHGSEWGAGINFRYSW